VYSSASDCVFAGGRDSTIRQFPLLQRKSSIPSPSSSSSSSATTSSSSPSSSAPTSTSPRSSFSSDNSEIQCFRGHLLPITSLASLSNNCLFSSSRDYSVRWWDIEHGTQIAHQTILGMVGVFGRRVSASDEHIVCTSSEDRQLRFWDNRTHDVVQSFSTGNDFVTHMDFSADGNYISVCHSASSPLSVLDRRTGNQVFSLEAVDAFTSSLFLPSMVGGESLVAAITRGNTLKIFNVANGHCLSSFTPESTAEMSHLACAIDTSGSLLSARNALFYTSTTQGIVQQWQINNHGNVAAILAQTRNRIASFNY
jgi:WD40 repeat protein